MACPAMAPLGRSRQSVSSYRFAQAGAMRSTHLFKSEVSSLASSVHGHGFSAYGLVVVVDRQGIDASLKRVDQAVNRRASIAYLRTL